jgi:hypothetical protein
VTAKCRKTNPQSQSLPLGHLAIAAQRWRPVLRLMLRHEVIRHNGQFPALAPSHCSGANAPSRTSGTPNSKAKVCAWRGAILQPLAREEKPGKTHTTDHVTSSISSGHIATGAARGTQKQNRIRQRQSEVCGTWWRYSAFTRQARRLQLCAMQKARQAARLPGHRWLRGGR